VLPVESPPQKTGAGIFFKHGIGDKPRVANLIASLYAAHKHRSPESDEHDSDEDRTTSHELGTIRSTNHVAIGTEQITTSEVQQHIHRHAQAPTRESSVSQHSIYKEDVDTVIQSTRKLVVFGETLEDISDMQHILAHNPLARVSWAKELNIIRGQAQIMPEPAFEQFCNLLLVSLAACHVEEDFSCGKTLMQMSSTFCFKDANNDLIYAQTRVQNAEIFKNQRFWIESFYESLSSELQRVRVMSNVSSRWSDVATEQQHVMLTTEENIVFGQIGPFALNMLSYGLPLSVVAPLVRRFSSMTTLQAEHVMCLQELLWAYAASKGNLIHDISMDDPDARLHEEAIFTFDQSSRTSTVHSNNYKSNEHKTFGGFTKKIAYVFSTKPQEDGLSVLAVSNVPTPVSCPQPLCSLVQSPSLATVPSQPPASSSPLNKPTTSKREAPIVPPRRGLVEPVLVQPRLAKSRASLRDQPVSSVVDFQQLAIHATLASREILERRQVTANETGKPSADDHAEIRRIMLSYPSFAKIILDEQ
jgi:hypothetical protein